MLLKRRNSRSMASKLRLYAAIESRVYLDDGEGGNTEQWAPIVGLELVPVSIEPLSAKRKEEYRTFNVDATHEIMLRYDAIGNTNISLLEKNHRITWNNYIYEIKTVENIQQRNVELVLICLERRE